MAVIHNSREPAIRNGSALLVSELFQVFPANATAEGAAGGGRMIIMAHI